MKKILLLALVVALSGCDNYNNGYEAGDCVTVVDEAGIQGDTTVVYAFNGYIFVKLSDNKVYNIDRFEDNFKCISDDESSSETNSSPRSTE